MKQLHVLIALVLFGATSTSAQIPTNEETGKAEYKYTGDISGQTSSQLYDRAHKWINKFYKNPNGVMTTQDKENGKIVGRARFKLSRIERKGHVNPNAGFVSYEITLQFKDGKYRYVIDGIRWEQPSYYDVSEWTNKEQTGYDEAEFTSYIEQTTKYFDELTASLQEYMRVGEPEKKDDW
jgi:hypothetical protein